MSISLLDKFCCKVTGPNNATVLNMGTREKVIDIFCFAHRTHHVSFQTCKQIEVTALVGEITDSAYRDLFVNS
jgi:hypothetical protein